MARAADAIPIWETASSHSKKKDPSLLDKVGTGTKKFFSDTVDFLTFKKKPSTTKKTSYNPYAPKQEEKGWWESTFGPKEAPPPKSLNEWMSLKRADP